MTTAQGQGQGPGPGLAGAVAARTETTTGTRFPLIESARGIAALLIVAYHAAKTRPAGGEAQAYLEHLAIGVPIFFLISGFLLYRPFVVARLEGRRPALRPYAERRLLRIVPAYWVALTLVALFGSGAAEVRSDPIVYYGFLQSFADDTVLEGIGQAWTLSSELLFYFLLPLYAIALAVGRRGVPRWGREALCLLALAVGAYVYTAAMVPTVETDGSGKWVLYVIPRFLGHFALGMGLAALTVWLAQRRDGAPPALRPLLAYPSATWILVPVGYWLAVDGGLPWAARDLVDGLVAAALLWPAIVGRPGEGFAGRVLGTRALLFAGTVSYGIYLYHFAVITRVDSTAGGGGFLGLFLVAAAGATIAGYVSWRVVEQPAITWGKRRHAAARARQSPPPSGVAPGPAVEPEPVPLVGAKRSG